MVVSDFEPIPRGGDGARCWVQIRHDQALFGAERSRVGIRLGLRAFSKADDSPSSRLRRDREYGDAPLLCEKGGVMRGAGWAGLTRWEKARRFSLRGESPNSGAACPPVDGPDKVPKSPGGAPKNCEGSLSVGRKKERFSREAKRPNDGPDSARE